ncbi:unnamed protein product [Rhodiola kirilowii]
MNSTFSNVVPPGFRFHPTDEELVDYYLRKRIASKRIDLDVIKDVDLYRIEPWDLQELCQIGTEDQSDYYFFSHKDKKYPTGTRTNRATKEGFWKATGRDKAIYVKRNLVGMRKTLVYYKGRAPNGQKLDWIMHEYRLETNENAVPQEEGWVVCRVFKKRIVATSMRKDGDHDHHDQSPSPCWYDEQASSSFIEDIMDYSPMRILSSSSHPYDASSHNHPSSYNSSCKQEQQNMHAGLHYTLPQDTSNFPDLSSQQLGSQQPMIPLSSSVNHTSLYGFGEQGAQHNYYDHQLQMGRHHVMHGNVSNNSFSNDEQQMSSDWRVLDKFVASQLSHEDHAFEVDQDADHFSGLMLNNGSKTTYID